MAARSTAVRVSGWSDPAFATVAEVVHVVAGLVFPPNRQPSAESGMRRAMTALRLRDPAALANAIRSPGDARAVLLAELTVGETYFFREPLQLELLATHILPAFAETRSAGEPLRIWSAGCASGEEPYTIAIMLRELGWQYGARILGTDVAQPRLDAARRAHYTKWSLRGAAPDRVDRWFQRRASHFLLRPEIRDAVEFEPLNLIADDYPSAATGTLAQDVILCRNVLIYFDMQSVALIATRLLAALSPDGWLMLGASDPPLAGLVPCEVMVTPGGIVYRRADRLPPSEPVVVTAALSPLSWDAPMWSASPPLSLLAEPRQPWATVTSEQVAQPKPAVTVAPTASVAPAVAGKKPDATREAYAASDYPRAEALARAAVTADPDDVGSWVLLVRALANQGRIREADDECVRALDHNRLVTELHVLHAMLLGSVGHLAEAAGAARRALYLDRGFVMGHLQLGDTLARLGNATAAARAFENAVDLLRDAPADELVPGADGVPVSRLRQIAEARLSSLRTGARG